MIFNIALPCPIFSVGLLAILSYILPDSIPCLPAFSKGYTFAISTRRLPLPKSTAISFRFSVVACMFIIFAFTPYFSASSLAGGWLVAMSVPPFFNTA
jgi:hypothetical protein